MVPTLSSLTAELFLELTDGGANPKSLTAGFLDK
jgi:hypothetical protein